MAESLVTKNVLKRIFLEKAFLRPDQVEERKIVGGNRCILQARNSKILYFLRSDFYLVTERSQFNLLLAHAEFFQDYITNVWIYGKNVHEYNRVYYYSLRHRENDERIGRM